MLRPPHQQRGVHCLPVDTLPSVASAKCSLKLSTSPQRQSHWLYTVPTATATRLDPLAPFNQYYRENHMRNLAVRMTVRIRLQQGRLPRALYLASLSSLIQLLGRTSFNRIAHSWKITALHLPIHTAARGQLRVKWAQWRMALCLIRLEIRIFLCGA